MDKQNELFLEIHTRNYPLLYMLARKKGIPQDDVDDMIQEVFLAYYEHYPLTWGKRKIRMVLAKILRNRCADYWRVSSKQDILYIDAEVAEDFSLGIAKTAENDNLMVLIRQEEIQEALQAIGSMKAEWAEVLRLRILEDRPMEEVSELLGISNDLARTRLMRGRRYLRELLRREPAGKKQ